MIRKLILALTIAAMCVFVLSFQTESVKAEPTTIGEWTTDGRIELCVHSFDTAPSIDYYPYEPETVGYVFAWVDLSLKNVGIEEVSTNTLYAYLKDTENYFYEREGVLSPKAFRLIDLPPGETIRGEIYWEVPSEAIIDEFIWHNHQSYISIIIPEFPDALLVPLFMIATLLAVILYRRRHSV